MLGALRSNMVGTVVHKLQIGEQLFEVQEYSRRAA